MLRAGLILGAGLVTAGCAVLLPAAGLIVGGLLVAGLTALFFVEVQ